MKKNSHSNFFKNYPKPEKFYDEMFSESGTAHSFCSDFIKEFNNLSLTNLKTAEKLSYQSFLKKGITFNVYGDEKSKEGKAFPVDIIPRLMSAEDWGFIEKGLNQRITALNLFLKDIYTEEKILKDKVIPKDLIYESPHFLREMKDTKAPFDVYVNLCGSDLVKTKKDFFVLEDNLRVPSGSSYMLTARQITRQNFIRLFRKCGVRRVDNYPLCLLESLKSLSEKENPVIAVLTPGVFNSAYFEHAFLASQMGVDLVQGQDLVFNENAVYIKTVKELKRVDVLYRRIDDAFLDPLVFRSDSELGTPGLFSAYKTGSVVIANAPGTGVADDKAVYSYIPKIIFYYLNESPLLKNVPTYLCRNKKDLDYTIAHFEELVIKPVGGSGGYGLIFGSKLSKKEKSASIEKITQDPKNYISQPILDISTSPCFIEDIIQPRHVDLRPFTLFGADFKSNIVPGGLCRVALEKGNLVVNSSQGGGSKDIWVMEE